MSIISSDGPASLSNPIGTNPSKFSSAGYENPWVPIEANNNTRLLTRTQQKTLSEHYVNHIKNRTFNNFDDLFRHQELMADSLLRGYSFLQSHIFALKYGPKPNG